jgi:hypothetical protein
MKYFSSTIGIYKDKKKNHVIITSIYVNPEKEISKIVWQQTNVLWFFPMTSYW